MLPITIDSTACYLLDCEEAWLKSPSGEFAVRSAMESGLSQRENRSAFAASTILTLNWRIYVEGAEARRWRAALRGYNNEPVLAPFWPAACLLADLTSCKWIGGLRLFFEPGEPGEGITTFQVLAGTNAPTSFTPSADCMVVPLAWCRFDSLPNPEAADGDEAMEIDLKTVETGPAEYAIAAVGVDLPAGPSLGALTPRLLDIVADWGSSVSSGGIDLRVDRERIGYGRAEATDYVDQSARRRQKVTLPPIGDEVAKLVALFAQVGNVGSFWVPGAFADARLAADSSASSATITVDDATYLADQRYIALVDADAIAARRIESRNGTALTLQSSPGAFAAGTAVSPLLLVRFAAAKLKITWTTPEVASAQIDVVELPTEEAVPAGETVGTTIGDLGTPIWLYVVTDGDLTWHYTSFESAIDAGALGLFTPRPIDHGDITSELNLQRHDVDLTVGWFAGSPFERARLDRLAPPLTVQIYEGSVANPAAAERIFTGKAAGYQFTGGKCTCKIAGPTALFDVRGPVAVTSPRCWTPMYSPLCGLSREALSVSVDLVGMTDGVLKFALPGSASYPPTRANYFRYGMCTRRSADGSTQRVSIAAQPACVPVQPELPPLGTIQAETAAWQASLAASGGVLATNSLAIANDLVTVLSAKSYREKIVYLMPFLGGNLAAAITPLIGASSGRPRSFGFQAGDFSEEMGLRGDTSSKKLITPLAAADLGSDGNGGLGCWILETGVSTERTVMGAFSGDNYNAFALNTNATAGAGFYWGYPATQHSYGQSYVPVREATGSTAGHYYGQRSAANLRKLYKTGELKATSPADNYVWGNSDLQLAVLGIASNYSDPVTPYFCPHRIGVAYFTDGTLSDAEAADFHSVLREHLLLPTGRLGTSQLQIIPTRAVNPPTAYPEAGWTLCPGCDHSWAACKALGNSANFRGCPHFPKTNPAMVSVKQETSSGSKK